MARFSNAKERRIKEDIIREIMDESSFTIPELKTTLTIKGILFTNDSLKRIIEQLLLTKAIKTHNYKLYYKNRPYKPKRFYDYPIVRHNFYEKPLDVKKGYTKVFAVKGGGF